MDQELLNLTVEEAKTRCKNAGLKLRITNKDGESLMGTCDYWADRVNVHIKDGVICKIVGRG